MKPWLQFRNKNCMARSNLLTPFLLYTCSALTPSWTIMRIFQGSTQTVLRPDVIVEYSEKSIQLWSSRLEFKQPNNWPRIHTVTNPKFIIRFLVCLQQPWIHKIIFTLVTKCTLSVTLECDDYIQIKTCKTIQVLLLHAMITLLCSSSLCNTSSSLVVDMKRQ